MATASLASQHGHPLPHQNRAAVPQVYPPTQQARITTNQAPIPATQHQSPATVNPASSVRGYTSRRWTNSEISNPIPVPTFGTGARSRVCWRALTAARRIGMVPTRYIKHFWLFPYCLFLLFLDLITRIVSGHRVQQSLPLVVNDFFLESVLLMFSRYFNNSWQYFWALYFVFAHGDEFYHSYWESWRQRAISQVAHADDVEFMFLLIDHDQLLMIPCPNDIQTDHDLMVHLGTFYYYLRTQGSLLEVLSGKNIARIDVIELYNQQVPGPDLCSLELGFYGAASRNIFLLKDPSLNTGSRLLDWFRSHGVIAKRGQTNCALNVVRTFDITRISSIVMIPFILSFLVSSVWPIIAVKRYHADVQSSVQASFAVGSYVVTAGALLVALAAFADARSGKR